MYITVYLSELPEEMLKRRRTVKGIPGLPALANFEPCCWTCVNKTIILIALIRAASTGIS